MWVLRCKRGTGHADRHFFTCITKNRLGADKCTGMSNMSGEKSTKRQLRLVLDAAHEATAVLAEVMEQKEAYENEYRMFHKLLSASNKHIPLSEIIDCVGKIEIDVDTHIVINVI